MANGDFDPDLLTQLLRRQMLGGPFGAQPNANVALSLPPNNQVPQWPAVPQGAQGSWGGGGYGTEGSWAPPPAEPNAAIPGARPGSLLDTLLRPKKEKGYGVEAGWEGAPFPGADYHRETQDVPDQSKLPSWRDTAGMIPTNLPEGPYGKRREVDGTVAAVPPGTSMDTAADQAGQQAGMLGGGFGKFMDALGRNSNLLMGLGAGLMGAPNLAQGFSRGLSYAMPGHEADIRQQLQTGSQSAMFNALVSSGVPRNLALAGAMDKEMGKAMLDQYISPQYEVKEQKTETPLGTSTRLVAVNKRDPADSFDVASGQPLGGGRRGGGGGGGGMVSPTQLAAPAGTTITQTPNAPGGGVWGNVPTPGGGGAGAAPAAGPEPSLDMNERVMQAAMLPPEYDPVTHRDEKFLAALDPITQQAVKDVAAGKLPATGRNMQKMMPLVARYEDGFEANRYQQRQKAQNSYYGGGPGQKAILAANTAIKHGMELQSAITDLDNFRRGLPFVSPELLNEIRGKYKYSRDEQYQAALKRFTTAKSAFIDEMGKVLTDKSTVSQFKELEKNLNEYAPPAANNAALKESLKLLGSRVEEHEAAYNTDMNTPGTQQFGEMLRNRPQLERMTADDYDPRKAPVTRAAAAPAAKIKPGSVLHYDAQGNQVSGP